MDNNLASIDATLKDLADTHIAVASTLQFIDDELVLIRERTIRAPMPRAAGAWPWAPGTQAQGFLGGRWNRRDGDVYATPALRAIPGPNSPIRGGDDAQSKVDVPSGARRS